MAVPADHAVLLPGAEAVMVDRGTETRQVKRYLTEAGYQATSVTHGAGTSWGWIYVNMTGPWPYEEFIREHERHVLEIAKIASGRDERRPDPDGYHNTEILIDYNQQASARKCACGLR